MGSQLSNTIQWRGTLSPEDASYFYAFHEDSLLLAGKEPRDFGSRVWLIRASVLGHVYTGLHDYWRTQLPAPVAFARVVSRARADGFDAFVEVGASGALTHCVEQVLAEQPGGATFTHQLGLTGVRYLAVGARPDSSRPNSNALAPITAGNKNADFFIEAIDFTK